MRIELNHLSPVKKAMTVEVDPEEVDRETSASVRRLAKQVRIPGFRPGKAPIEEVRRRFSGEVEEDVRDRLMRRLYRDATREKGLRPIGEPVVEDVHQHEGCPFRFTATFEVLPEFELQGYKGVEVRRPATRIAEAEVDTFLEELRESRAHLVTEEGREASRGDVVVVDLAGRPAEGEPFTRERAMIEVGSPNNPPGFNDRLQGVRAGERIEIDSEVLPGPGAGADARPQRVSYALQVHEVKRKDLPELDDEFAKDLGDFEDLAALRRRVADDLAARKKVQAEREVQNAVLDKVLLVNPVVLPELLVEQEVRQRLEELVVGLVRQGIDPQKIELDWQALRDRQVEPARKAVHARLVLDAVARAESIEVTKAEVDARLRRDAARSGDKAEALLKRTREPGFAELVRNQIVREKSLDLLMAVANIHDEE